MARKPITLKSNTFRQWRENTNTVSNSLGDMDAKVFLDTYNQATIDDLVGIEADGTAAKTSKHETKILAATWSAGATQLSFNNVVGFGALRVGMTVTSGEKFSPLTTITAISYTSNQTGTVTFSPAAVDASGGSTAVAFTETAVSFANDLEIRKMDRVGGTIKNVNITGTLSVDGVATENQILAVNKDGLGDNGAAKLKTLTSGDNTISFVHDASAIDIRATGVFPTGVSYQGPVEFDTGSYVSMNGQTGGLPIGQSETLIVTKTVTVSAAPTETILALTAANYRSIEYTVQISNGTNYMVTKLMVIRDDSSNINLTEYGTIKTTTMFHDVSVSLDFNFNLFVNNCVNGDVVKVLAIAMKA